MKHDGLWWKAFLIWFGGLMMFFSFTVLLGIWYSIVQIRSTPLSTEEIMKTLVVLEICFTFLAFCFARLLADDSNEEITVDSSRAQKVYRTLRLRVLAENGVRVALFSNFVGWCIALVWFLWKLMMFWGEKLYTTSHKGAMSKSS